MILASCHEISRYFETVAAIQSIFDVSYPQVPIPTGIMAFMA
jgi:hypothetical protein